jgi:hypothetical protein
LGRMALGVRPGPQPREQCPARPGNEAARPGLMGPPDWPVRRDWEQSFRGRRPRDGPSGPRDLPQTQRDAEVQTAAAESWWVPPVEVPLVVELRAGWVR